MKKTFHSCAYFKKSLKEIKLILKELCCTYNIIVAHLPGTEIQNIVIEKLLLDLIFIQQFCMNVYNQTSCKGSEI